MECAPSHIAPATPGVELSQAQVRQILTRSSGFLRTVCSHSLQPYRGCALGNTLCGVGCYVRHNWYVTHGQPWGSFVEVRTNAAEVYREQYDRERQWARERRGRFGIFLSSSTEPFQPAEFKYRMTRSVLEAMLERPPDFLILQSHSHRVADYLELYRELSRQTELRVHVSVESDRDRLPGLPPPASSIEKRLEAARKLKSAGLRVVITVAPLLPIEDPGRFFARISEVADAVVIDHYIGGDGTTDGVRTRRTPLPLAMAGVDPATLSLEYRDRMMQIARQVMPARVGVNIDGFAGRMLP